MTARFRVVGRLDTGRLQEGTVTVYRQTGDGGKVIRLRIVPFALMGAGAVCVQRWDRFTEEWRLWDCPYVAFKRRSDAVAHIRRVLEGCRFRIERAARRRPTKA